MIAHLHQIQLNWSLLVAAHEVVVVAEDQRRNRQHLLHVVSLLVG